MSRTCGSRRRGVDNDGRQIIGAALRYGLRNKLRAAGGSVQCLQELAHDAGVQHPADAVAAQQVAISRTNIAADDVEVERVFGSDRARNHLLVTAALRSPGI